MRIYIKGFSVPGAWKAHSKCMCFTICNIKIAKKTMPNPKLCLAITGIIPF